MVWALPGALKDPWGLAIDRNDRVYVADTSNHRIQVFTRMGEFLTEWGKKDANGLPVAGTGNGEFNGPAGLTFDNIGQLYVSDSNNHRVQVFGYSGMINGTLTPGGVVNHNLTTEGTVDWAVWGTGTSASLAPVARKNGVTPRIGNLIDISNGNPLRGLGQFGGSPHTFQWQDGTPTLSASGVMAGLQHEKNLGTPSAVGEGFAVTVPADTTQRRVRLYSIYHESFAQVTATLSDGSAPPFVAAVNTAAGNNMPVAIDITYAAASVGQTLTISWVVTHEFGNYANVAVFAATLNGAQFRPASSGESGPVEPVLPPIPSESSELPAAQLYLPLIVQPSTEQEEDFVPLDSPTIPDMPLLPEAIPALIPSVPITSTPASQSP